MAEILISDIPKYSKHNFLSQILFGSYSRGDHDSISDIDVLEITPNIEKPYSNNEVNFSPYTFAQLIAMAKEGNLFILHIIMEGKMIAGDFKYLEELKSYFKKPKSYDSFRKEIILTSRLLDVDEEQFIKNSKGYYGLLSYLFRSYLYSIMYDKANLKFSIKQISKHYSDNEISKVFAFKHKIKVNYLDFQFCKTVFEKYASISFINPYVDTLDLMKNLKATSKFGFSIALHYLVELADELYSISDFK